MNQQFTYKQELNRNVRTRQGCEFNPCFPGAKCMKTYQYPGFECGACPFGFVGNGQVCTRLEFADEDYGCGEKCDEILIEKEVIVAPCELKIEGKCTPDTCEESNPCAENEICIDEDKGTRCEPKPTILPRAHRDKIATPRKLEAYDSGEEITQMLEELQEKFEPICDEDTCFPGVICKAASTGPSCGKCPLGFKGDGKFCEKLTCEDSPCFPGSK